ncbi:MAG: erythromycin esterase family protein [Acidobacteriota bacterium]|nr:erythromycin esterase family protein [Acidobacteriota bacterium]
MTVDARLTDVIREKAVSLEGAGGSFDQLLSDIGDRRFVLMGEASHGTHEFYKARAEITKRLIAEKDFSAVAVEADFPDAYRVNRYIRGVGKDQTANDALSDFNRFPLWMWRNADVLDLVGWLRAHNDKFPKQEQKAGFYGIDLYSLHASIEAVLKYLEKVDPDAARRARYRYGCFEDFGEDPQTYGYAAGFNMEMSCEKEVINQLIELQRRAAEYANRDGFVARDEYFYAEQNARLVKNAEEYYRSMFRGRASSWNLRDRHMAETLHALSAHLEQSGQSGKLIVWAHNSHLGDARATDMGEHGEWNVGQLIREKYGDDAFLLGFTTYSGTVTAASNWDEPAQLKRVRPGMENSYEQLFHETGLPQFYLNLRDDDAHKILRQPRLERAIGVIYRPESERVSHYFNARLAVQFDAVIHFDETRAVEPLDKVSTWQHDDAPETFPTGI